MPQDEVACGDIQLILRITKTHLNAYQLARVKF